MNLEIKSNLARFNSALRRYADLREKPMDEVTAHKGRDLGIRLYRGFRAVRWGGGNQTGSKLAFAELAARTKAGRGTKVRASLREKFASERSQLLKTLLGLNAAKVRQGGLSKYAQKLDRKLRRNRSNLWRIIVGAEVRARGRGIGVLAASFLWFRRASNSVLGEHFVANRTGHPLGGVEVIPGGLRIVGFTEGLDLVDARNNIVNTAIVEALADTQQYLDRYDQAFALAFGGAA